MSEKTGDNTFRVEPQSLQKTPTKIEGLDEVLHGGLPTGRLSIISGGPGAGKTVVGLEILVRGTELGQPAIFISFEEEKEKIQRNAQAMGWDLVSLEKAEKLAMINPEIDYKAAFSGEFNIDGLFAILKGQAQRIGAKMIVIDAVDMLMRMFKDPVQARNQIIELHRWLSEQNLTAVMTVKAKDNDHEEYDYLDFMADCVIKLDQRTHDQVTTRRLHVIKYRGSDFSSREHPFVITDEGVVVMPLPFIDLVPRSKGQLISTGNLKMDEILGGGYRKGASLSLIHI